jgi:hypothetical protein
MGTVSDIMKKKLNKMTLRTAYFVGKYLENLIDPETGYYRKDSDDSDETVAALYELSPTTIRKLRCQIWPQTKGRKKSGDVTNDQ